MSSSQKTDFATSAKVRISQASPAASKARADLQNAVALHQRGRFAGAEQIYRHIRKVTPDRFDAQHLLGVLKDQQGANAEAILISVVLQKVVALSNYGAILNELKRFEEALASYDRAIAPKPDYAEGINNRAIALKERKRFDEVLASYDQAIALEPRA